MERYIVYALDNNGYGTILYETNSLVCAIEFIYDYENDPGYIGFMVIDLLERVCKDYISTDEIV